MPRNSQGVYSLPSGNPVVPGTIISSDWANPTMQDLGNEITASLPRDGAAPMTGQLLLSGDATAPLEAVSLQQIQNLIKSSVPEGTITPWIGGYFGDGVNGSYVDVLGQTSGEINARVSGAGYRHCNGDSLNLSTSQIFNGTGRYLPNLTDDRILMGSTTGGTIGGTNTVELDPHLHPIPHTHGTGDFALEETHNGRHRHVINVYYSTDDGTYVDSGQGNGSERTVNTTYSGDGTPHNHGITDEPSVDNTGEPTEIITFDNRPQFLSCHYIMKVEQ